MPRKGDTARVGEGCVEGAEKEGDAVGYSNDGGEGVDLPGELGGR